jgi:hypothetical protein
MSGPDLKIAPVVDLPVITSLPINVDRVINAALGKLKEVVVVGYDEDGDLYFASSEPGGPEVLWLLEKAKLALLDISK